MDEDSTCKESLQVQTEGTEQLQENNIYRTAIVDGKLQMFAIMQVVFRRWHKDGRTWKSLV